MSIGKRKKKRERELTGRQLLKKVVYLLMIKRKLKFRKIYLPIYTKPNERNK